MQRRERRVDRVGDVDDHLAIELTGVGAEHVVDGRVRDREHDDVAVQMVADRTGAHVAGELVGERPRLLAVVPTSVTRWLPASARVATPRAMLPVPMIVISIVALPESWLHSQNRARRGRLEWQHRADAWTSRSGRLTIG